MGWCEADFRTDLSNFYTKDGRINSGAVIPTHPALRSKLLSVLLKCCLVVARVDRSQAPYRLATAPAHPDDCWL